MSGLVALPSPQKLQICKLGDIRAIRRPQADYSTKNEELRKDSLQEYNSSIPLIEREIFTLLQKLDGEQDKRSERSCTGSVRTRTEGRQIFPLRWVCTICLDNDASEAEVITDTKKSRVNHQIH